MSRNKFLTQKEIEAALESVIDELEFERNEDAIDAVYIPPEVDVLTDEENIDDEYIPTENLSQDPDIAGTFEMHLPTADDADTDEFDSSDEETLASKKQKLGSKETPAIFLEPEWRKGEIEYTHSPISNESNFK
ncbi:hypothetical protein QE152_g29632 [Popillia japonica]|uniref:Uncharacterized protein n=1 Tax=Popillia japonica TaxID=7064 RepID=A0AAW1JGX8_POPJA